MARPREFDADSVVDRALDVFWRKGFEATSLDDLCEATGLSRSSLYATFGSKRNLLRRSVDRYVKQRTPGIAEILSRPLPVRDAFAALAADFIDQIVAGPGRRGCFLGNCAAEMARGDKASAERVRRGLDTTKSVFHARLVQARKEGELARDADIEALARFLTAGFQGLRLIGRVNPRRDMLEDIAATMLKCLD